MTIQEQAVDLGWTVGARCRQARRRADMTQRELAEQIGVDENTVSNYEGGITKRHNRSTLSRWALACGVTMDYLRLGIPDDTGGQFMDEEILKPIDGLAGGVGMSVLRGLPESVAS